MVKRFKYLETSTIRSLMSKLSLEAGLKILVGSVAFNGYGMVKADLYMELLERGNKLVWKELIWVEFKEPSSSGNGYGQSISPTFSFIDLRGFIVAMKEIVYTGKSDYQKYTDPTKRGDEKNNKMVSLKLEERKKHGSVEYIYWLNVNKIGVGFNRYQLEGFAEQLVKLCDEGTETLFKYQQKMFRDELLQKQALKKKV
jgi:hypothetical protein